MRLSPLVCAPGANVAAPRGALPRETGPAALGVRPPAIEPRTDPDAELCAAGLLPGDESGESASAAAIPPPARTAAPTPSAAARPRTPAIDDVLTSALLGRITVHFDEVLVDGGVVAIGGQFGVAEFASHPAGYAGNQ